MPLLESKSLIKIQSRLQLNSLFVGNLEWQHTNTETNGLRFKLVNLFLAMLWIPLIKYQFCKMLSKINKC